MRTLGWMIVNAAQVAFLAVVSSILMIVAFVSRILGPDAPLQVAGRLWAPALLWISGSKFEIEGGEAVDWKKPHLFLMNHQSALDIPVAFAAIRSPVRFVAKKVLGRVPVLGWYMLATRMILVDREKGSQAIAAIQIAADRLRRGANILIYPEGTRSKDSRILPFKKGPFVVALQAQVPIVPLVVHGAAQVMPRGTFRVRPSTIRVKIGAPIPTEGLGVKHRDELMFLVREQMLEMHRSIGGEGGEPSEPVRRGPREAAREARHAG
ncbi:lysophospholipid acyltransferase family protein [Vulgatibacter incomptus]|uniref:1-acyl-sn-glycerol-3-phosphate acyltransferase n=1 Tax=Vulgatibacter incomptus TaxID=1391653 RepID=A0A0K1P8F2_9BACT|nr:lysophospholipid acyltransferase family protein [Vulgatibacter incomptus]AKU89795.1 1-acyl-sn-glycerol-3-phosphate acyltransferase [Vulgatibacter incomptus]